MKKRILLTKNDNIISFIIFIFFIPIIILLFPFYWCYRRIHKEQIWSALNPDAPTWSDKK